MKLYLDTGNINEIEEVAKMSLLDGVTTNPSLILKEGKNFENEILNIVKILKTYSKNYTLSVEVSNISSSENIIKEAKKLLKYDKNIIIKVPITVEGIKAICQLSKNNIKCNATLCFSVNQALLAAKAGAFFVSPFVGRIDDEGWRGLELISDIKRVYDNYNYNTLILAASIRSAEHVYECAKIGVDIVTLPTNIYKKLYYHPLTDIGINKFNSDWRDYLNQLKK